MTKPRRSGAVRARLLVCQNRGMSYSPPPPYQPAPTGPAPKRGNGLGLAALILGIAAFVGAFIPFVNYISGVIAFVGLVLGIIAVVLKARRRAAAIAGIILSAVALVLSIILAVFYTAWLFGSIAEGIRQGQDGATGQTSLIYQVDGTGSDVDISYSAYTDGISTTQQSTGQALPFEQEYVVSTGGAATYNSYTITATNGAAEGDVTCRIILDGKVLTEQTSTGPYSTASCTASGTELLR